MKRHNDMPHHQLLSTTTPTPAHTLIYLQLLSKSEFLGLCEVGKVGLESVGVVGAREGDQPVVVWRDRKSGTCGVRERGVVTWRLYH